VTIAVDILEQGLCGLSRFRDVRARLHHTLRLGRTEGGHEMASGPTKPFHWRDREHDVHPEGSTAGLVQESGNRQKSVALGERHTRPEPRTQRLN
jgi:hypothetical protein